MRKKVFVKVSGDEYTSTAFIAWIKKLAQISYVVICVGGGTQIKKEFARRGWKTDNYGPLGRETSIVERLVAQKILEQNQFQLRSLLASQGVRRSVVVSPLLTIGGIFCHVNGDQYLITAYLGFDELYVVTTPEREGAKKEQFAHLPKIKVKIF